MPPGHMKLSCAIRGSLSQAVSLLFSLKLFAGTSSAMQCWKQCVISKLKRSESCVLCCLLTGLSVNGPEKGRESEKKTDNSTTQLPLMRHAITSVAFAIIALQIAPHASVYMCVCAWVCVWAWLSYPHDDGGDFPSAITVGSLSFCG